MADCVNKNDQFVNPLYFLQVFQHKHGKCSKIKFALYKHRKNYDLSAGEQIAHLCLWPGSEFIPKCSLFVSVDTDLNKKKTLVNRIKIFDTYFEPVENVIFERSDFNKIAQVSGQSVHQFIVKLLVQSENF